MCTRDMNGRDAHFFDLKTVSEIAQTLVTGEYVLKCNFVRMIGGLSAHMSITGNMKMQILS